MQAFTLSVSAFVLSASLMLFTATASAQQGVGVTHYQELSSSLDMKEPVDESQKETSPAPWQRANFHPLLYPRDMALRGIEGCAVYKTTISKDGDVEALDVTRSVPGNLKKSTLLQPAKLIKWQIPPGAESAHEVKEFRINFCMGENQSGAKARCEQFAALPCHQD